MNKRDTIVATTLLFVLSFAISFKAALLLLSYLWPETALQHAYVLYAISALAAVLVAITVVRHFFPGIGRTGSI